MCHLSLAKIAQHRDPSAQDRPPLRRHGSDSGVSRNLRNLFRRLGIRFKTNLDEHSQRQMMEDVDVL